jgi:hypothetical protein
MVVFGLESIFCEGYILRVGIRSTTQAPMSPAASNTPRNTGRL